MKFIITNILIIVLILIISCLLSTRYVKLDYNDFFIEQKNKSYTQGDVVVFLKVNTKKDDDCSKYNAKILDYTKNIVGEGYCRNFENSIKIFADTSEFPQGKYYLLTKENGKNRISKDDFVIEIINDYEITGEKR